jgi:hypothetical protein
VFDFVTSVARLRWALEHGCRWNELICAAAAAGGHIGVLQWARDQDPPCPWDLKTCATAARGGHLEVLQWVREQKPPCLLNAENWDWNTCTAAAFGGHLEVLQWARTQVPPCKSGWSSHTCHEAAAGGHLEVLKWLREQSGTGEPALPRPRAPRGAAVGTGPGSSLSVGRENLRFRG